MILIFLQNSSTESDDDDILYKVPHIHNKRVQALLLFKHITEAQRQLLKCCNNLILMDSTYRTCQLMLPTFFLAVKTNVGYSPIAMFMVQTEDATSISEALGRIKNYLAHENMCIKTFMIDCSPTEMQSLKETFPNVGMYLCNFHRNHFQPANMPL